MNTDSVQIVFLNSYLPRTGHNFAAEVIRIFTNHETLPYNHSETRLSRVLTSYYKIHDQTIYHQRDKEFMDHLFINNLRSRIIEDSTNPYLMIKDTTLMGVEFLQRTFPKDHHIVLIRNPKDVFNSLIKGMSLKKPSINNILKKLGNELGLYPWFYSRKLSQKVLKEMPNLNQHIIIRYEDLVMKNECLLTELKEKFHTNKSLEQIKKEISEIQVINSSFFEEVGAKKIWDTKRKTQNYNPINRKSNTWLVRKGIELGSRKLRKKLDYI